MANRYLLEVGTEELPVEFLKSAPPEWQEKVQALLSESRLACDSVKVYATPRRLTLMLEGLPDKQEAQDVLMKGPPVKVAFDAEGKPTQAAVSFAGKSGADVTKLVRETIDGTEYVVFRKREEGRPVKDILAEKLPDTILSLSGSHFMLWGEETVRFSRPIRWLLSLWNDALLPLNIGVLAAGTESRGHRFLSEGKLSIGSIDSYMDILEANGKVIVDAQRRKREVHALLQQEAKRLGGILPENEDLLDTVTMLVEHPSIVVGNIESRFLDIPKEVTVTVMAAHQKYFPVEKSKGGELLPYFLTVSNGDPGAADNIRKGNERVLKARLEDARFFFDDDRAKSLESRLEQLQGITFQKGLGNMLEKTHRLENLSEYIAQAMGLSKEQTTQAKRAARLAKADLVTGMVRELTELQGVMGKKYALLQGEDPAVAEALFEQYLPRFWGDAVATQPVGIAVSLADKIDTMIAVFSLKNAKHPTGSKDPLGLRRMASGLIQTIFENKLPLNIYAAMDKAHALLEGKAEASCEDTLSLVQSFILQRLKGALLDQGFRYDVIDAVLESRNPLENLCDVTERLELLKALTQSPQRMEKIYEPANRISRILGKAYLPDAQLKDVDPALLKDDTEKVLHKAFLAVDENQSYEKLVAALEGVAPSVEAFFEKVLVNDPDEKIKQNRYRLLSVANRMYLRIAHFPTLVIAGAPA